MKKNLFLLACLILGASLLLAACTSASSSVKSRPAAPSTYVNKTNPLAGNADAIAKGKMEYTNNCLACHGQAADGNGPAGASLSPKPTSLVNALKETSVGYFFWRTADGGGMDPFKSSMPAFKGVLSEEKIWQIVTYIQTLK